MSPVNLELPVQRWECRYCNVKDVTRGEPNRWHNCRGLGGIMAPLMLEENRGKQILRAKIREDYVGREVVTTDDSGRPVMAVETIRDDGSNDLAVFAPCATTRADASRMG